MKTQNFQPVAYKKITLQKDTFVLSDDKGFILYSPFTGLIAKVHQFPEEASSLYRQLKTRGFFQLVPDTTRRDIEWKGFYSLTLLLTRSCNLSCTYCYASANPERLEGSSMSIDLAINSLEWFAAQVPKPRLRISFHGGGEPTLEQKTIKAVVSRGNKIRGSRPVHYFITTNGTAEKEFMDWLMENRFGISISMDGPSDIQNRNRPLANGGPSSRIIESNVKYLVSRRYPVSIRITYSPVDDIVRIIRYFSELGIKRLHLEPLFPHGRFYPTIEFGKRSQYDIYSPIASELLKKFLQAIDVCKEYGMRVYNGHLIHFTKGVGYFCGAARGRSMVVTHDGLLTGCLEVVDSNDEYTNAFEIGRWVSKERRFKIDTERITVLQRRHADVLPKCKDCFARYTCVGGCAVKAMRASGNFFERDIPYCGFTRGLVPILIKKIARASKI